MQKGLIILRLSTLQDEINASFTDSREKPMQSVYDLQSDLPVGDPSLDPLALNGNSDFENNQRGFFRSWFCVLITDASVNRIGLVKIFRLRFECAENEMGEWRGGRGGKMYVVGQVERCWREGLFFFALQTERSYMGIEE